MYNIILREKYVLLYSHLSLEVILQALFNLMLRVAYDPISKKKKQYLTTNIHGIVS